MIVKKNHLSQPGIKPGGEDKAVGKNDLTYSSFLKDRYKKIHPLCPVGDFKPTCPTRANLIF